MDTKDFSIVDVIGGLWREETTGIPSVPRAGPHQESNKAKEKRLAYKMYFVNEGAVKWQSRMIHDTLKLNYVH